MKKYLPLLANLITVPFLLVVLLLHPSVTHASSGPVGLNELRTESGPGVGEVTLMWRRYNLNVTNYSLIYGTQPGKYSYGANSIGNIVTYTVKNLVPGQRYCFLLYPHLDGNISTSNNPEICEVGATSSKTVKGTAGPYGRNLLTAVKGSVKGQVTLNWKRFLPDTDSYNLVYGLKPGVYIYGVTNAKDASNPGDNDFTFNVGSLQSGVRYYFALIPQVQSQARYIGAEVSQVAP